MKQEGGFNIKIKEEPVSYYVRSASDNGGRGSSLDWEGGNSGCNTTPRRQISADCESMEFVPEAVKLEPCGSYHQYGDQVHSELAECCRSPTSHSPRPAKQRSPRKQCKTEKHMVTACGSREPENGRRSSRISRHPDILKNRVETGQSGDLVSETRSRNRSPKKKKRKCNLRDEAGLGSAQSGTESESKCNQKTGKISNTESQTGDGLISEIRQHTSENQHGWEQDQEEYVTIATEETIAEPLDQNQQDANSRTSDNQPAIVKTTDLFVGPEVDDVIHRDNVINGKGRAEKLFRDQFAAQGYHVRTGRWRKEESQKLQANWNDILKKHPIEDPYGVFERRKCTSRERKQSLNTFVMETSFYTSLARGLNRTTYSCYVRARKMFHPLKEGSYTKDEYKTLKRLRSTHGNKWTEIGKKMERTGSSLYDMHRWRGKKTNSGPWSEKEEKQLLASIRKVIGSNDLSNLYHQIPWLQVAGNIPSRSAPQCREHWIKKLAWRANNFGVRKKWRKRDKRMLVDRIYALPIFDESEIDWDEIHLLFKNSTSPQYVQTKWVQLKTSVGNYHRKSFDEIRHILYQKHGTPPDSD